MILGELTSTVVQATCLHQSHCGLYGLWLDDSLTSRWVNTIVSEHSSETSHALYIYQHGALNKVPIEAVICEFLCGFECLLLRIGSLSKHQRSQGVVCATCEGFFFVERKIYICAACV